MPKVNDPTLTASSASRMFRYSKSIFCLFELFCSLLTLSRNSLIRAKVGKFALYFVMASISCHKPALYSNIQDIVSFSGKSMVFAHRVGTCKQSLKPGQLEPISATEASNMFLFGNLTSCKYTWFGNLTS